MRGYVIRRGVQWSTGAFILICLVQVVKNVSKQSLILQDDVTDYPDIQENAITQHLTNIRSKVTSEVESNELVTTSPIENAVSSLQQMQRTLSEIQQLLDHADSFYHSAVLPALAQIQIKLEEMRVHEYDRERVRKILSICADQVEELCAIVKDDLKSLFIDVQFIISDLNTNINNVVPSSFGTMRTFMKEFDLSFSKNKIGLERVAHNVQVAILRALPNKEDSRISEIQSTLSVLTGDLKSELEDIMTAKKKYDSVKGDAARDLNHFITMS